MAGLYNCSSSWEFNGLASVCLLMQRTLAPPLITIPWMQVLLAVRLPGGDDLWWNLFDNPSCRGNPWDVVLSFPAAPQLPLAGHRLLCRMRRRPLLCRSPSESSRAGKLLTGPDPAQGGAQEAIDPTYIYRSCSPDNQARICNPLLFLQCKVHQWTILLFDTNVLGK